MFTHNYKLSVRFGDTDQMGYYVYNANYGNYFEQARTEALHSLGINIKDLEAEGITMPVTRMNIKFMQPAYYYDVLTIKTTIPYMPNRSMIFQYEIYNEKGELINKAETQMAFGNVHNQNLVNAPSIFQEKLEKFFTEHNTQVVPLNADGFSPAGLPDHIWKYKKAG